MLYVSLTGFGLVKIEVTMAHVCVRQLLSILLVMALFGILVAFPVMAQLEEASSVCRLMMCGLTVLAIFVMAISNIWGQYGTEDVSQGSTHRLYATANLRNQTRYGDEIVNFLEKYAHVINIYIFGAASIIYRLYSIVARLPCIQFYITLLPKYLFDGYHLKLDQYQDVVYLTLTCLHLLYSTLKIPFLVKLSHYTCVHTKRTAFVHQVLLVMIGVDFADWVFHFLREMDAINFYSPPPAEFQNITNLLAVACIEHTNVLLIYQHSQLSNVYFPMILEFMLTSVEVFIHVLLIKHAPRNRVDGIDYVNDVPLSDGNDDDDDDDRDNILIGLGSAFSLHSRMWYCPIWKLFITKFTSLTALVMGILDAVLTHSYLVNLLENGEEVDPHAYYLSKHLLITYGEAPMLACRIFLSFTPALLVVCHCFCVLKTFKKVRKNVPPVKRGDVILILSAIGHVILRFYQFLISLVLVIQAKKRKNELGYEKDESIYLYLGSALEALISIPQNILSICVIFYGERREVTLHDSLHPYYSTLQGSLSFLTLFSFIRWIVDSFYETELLLQKAEAFGELWIILVVGLLPFLIYFRFVCVSHFLRIKKLLRETEFEAS